MRDPVRPRPSLLERRVLEHVRSRAEVLRWHVRRPWYVGRELRILWKGLHGRFDLHERRVQVPTVVRRKSVRCVGWLRRHLRRLLSRGFRLCEQAVRRGRARVWSRRLVLRERSRLLQPELHLAQQVPLRSAREIVHEAGAMLSGAPLRSRHIGVQVMGTARRDGESRGPLARSCSVDALVGSRPAPIRRPQHAWSEAF